MPPSQLTSLVQDLRRVAGASPRSDEQLLEAFARFRDEQAFADLVRRHGPLVMGVCRRSLAHEQDAEDAFQATFLALARQSGSIRHRGSLAAWLHGVSYRIAMTAKRTILRQRRNEQAGARPEATPPGDDLTWREVRGLLDEEVAGLPDAYRTVFVLCCLQERSKPEAAQMLGLKEGTVSSRLARAKERLHEALTKRGVTLSVLLATLGLGQSAKLSAAALRAAARVAAADAAGACGVVPARVAALADGVTRAMFVTKAKMATALAVFVGAILAPLAAQAPRKMEPDARAKDLKGAQEVKPNPATAVRGRVLDPDGKPVKGAKVYRVVNTNLDAEHAEPPRLLAESDAEGRFRAGGPFPTLAGRNNSPPLWIAAAPGFGPAVVEERARPEELTFRVVKDAAVSGRIVNLEGRPVPGVVVRPIGIAMNEKEDLQGIVAAAESGKLPTLNNDLLPRQIFSSVGVPGLPARVTTDADGRFRLTGVGRERVVELMLSGPRIESDFLFVMTREGKPFRVPDHPGAELEHRVYPMTFQHVVSPPQPLVGTVRDGATGKPVAGARIDVGMGPLMIETSGADGSYRYDSLPGLMFRDPREREFIVTVLPPAGEPYLPVMKRGAIGRPSEPRRLDITLTRGVWAEGKVTHKQTGKPVRAELEYYPDVKNPSLAQYLDPPSQVFANSQMFFKTKADGTFRIPVLPGRGAVGARASSGTYLPADSLTSAQVAAFAQLPTNVANLHAVAAIDADAPTKVALVVDPGQTLRCTIVGPDGKPVSGARVRGVAPHDFWGPRPLPGPEVTLEAMHPSQPRWLVVIHPEQQLGAEVEVPGDAKEPFEVRLQPTATITGRLLDPEGRPWKRQELRTYYDKKGARVLRGHFPELTATDDDGRFRVTGLVPGLIYQINVAGKPPNTTTGSVRAGLKPRPGETIDLGDVKPRMFRQP